MPQSWIRRCAGVQKESRPTLSCQEMSQTPPTTLQATAMTLHQMYQGIEKVLAETRSAVRDCSVAGRGSVPAIWFAPGSGNIFGAAKGEPGDKNGSKDPPLQRAELVYTCGAESGMGKWDVS